MRVRVSKTARRDLDAIFDYWARRASPEIAGQLIYSIKDRFLVLADSPDIGRTASDMAPGIRVFPAGKFLIYYRKVGGVLHIQQILHGARDQARAFRKD
jgi:toxin ParE1/3/4